ncbi:DUF305 domain-containing protein [Pedobacter cryophilus]|uniref:DUF305 domain-containing protein n=1 Tax=Pedobacter cryophilus TaxID=2571271 RepID=A0A4U1C1I4_9SPHI|nr:DUF305 domain-containing protein [Pedobacter cryophilus]TKB97753.1 DUF305 domain-containing protein [Pedobacter cryophilus]
MIKIKNLFAITLIAGSYALTSCSNSDQKTSNNNEHMNHDSMMNSSKMNSDNPMMNAMNSSMSGMHEMKPSGDFDCDFANMMILHHQGAVAMSNLVIEKGANEEKKSLATNIKTKQEAEIAKMHTIIKNFKTIAPDGKPVEIHEELTESMNSMMSGMSSIKTTGDVDNDFVMLMIPHHESAVKMAKDQLKYGKQPALIEMAQQMITDQEKEINMFKALLPK